MQIQSTTILTDQLGIISIMILQRMNTSKLKRDRRTAFREMVNLIKLSRLLPEEIIILEIGEGIDYLGVPIILIRYQEEA